MWASTRSCFLMPDGADLQLVLGDPKRPFGIDQLDVAFPDDGRIGLVQVGSQQVAALAQARPVAPAAVARPGDPQPLLPLRRREPLDLHLERPGRPPVLAQQSAQPPVGHAFILQPSALGASLHLPQRLFQPLEEPLVHRLLLLAAIGAAGQQKRLVPFGPGHQLHFHALLHFMPVLVRQVLARTAATSPWACPRGTGRRGPAETPGFSR